MEKRVHQRQPHAQHHTVERSRTEARRVACRALFVDEKMKLPVQHHMPDFLPEKRIRIPHKPLLHTADIAVCKRILRPREIVHCKIG